MQTGDEFDDGVGRVGPTPMPRASTHDDAAPGRELVESLPGAGYCSVCERHVPPPALVCPEDGSPLGEAPPG